MKSLILTVYIISGLKREEKRERERERKGENTELFIGQHVAAEIDRSGAEQAERRGTRGGGGWMWPRPLAGRSTLQSELAQ